MWVGLAKPTAEWHIGEYQSFVAPVYTVIERGVYGKFVDQINGFNQLCSRPPLMLPV